MRRPRKVKTDDDLERLVLDCENAEAEFNLDRGVFVKMKRSEVELGEDLRDDYESEADSVEPPPPAGRVRRLNIPTRRARAGK